MSRALLNLPISLRGAGMGKMNHTQKYVLGNSAIQRRNLSENIINNQAENVLKVAPEDTITNMAYTFLESVLPNSYIGCAGFALAAYCFLSFTIAVKSIRKHDELVYRHLHELHKVENIMYVMRETGCEDYLQTKKHFEATKSNYAVACRQKYKRKLMLICACLGAHYLGVPLVLGDDFGASTAVDNLDATFYKYSYIKDLSAGDPTFAIPLIHSALLMYSVKISEFWHGIDKEFKYIGMCSIPLVAWLIGTSFSTGLSLFAISSLLITNGMLGLFRKGISHQSIQYREHLKREEQLNIKETAVQFMNKLVDENIDYRENYKRLMLNPVIARKQRVPMIHRRQINQCKGNKYYLD